MPSDQAILSNDIFGHFDANRTILLASAMRDIARQAGELTEKMRLAGVTPEIKSDGSVVTPADRASERLIAEQLHMIMKDYEDILPAGTAIVGEEAIEAGDKPDTSAGNFFVVDPIDATKNFVEGEPGVDLYTINIGLVLNNIPFLGVIHEPVSGDQIATRDHVSSVISIAGGIDIDLVPGVENDQNGDPLRNYKRGAMSYADLVRGTLKKVSHGKSYEWDTAAQDAILRTLGTRITLQSTGEPLPYNKVEDKFFNPPIIARM